MSYSITNIFATPLLIGHSDNAEIRKKICALAYEFKATAQDAGLVSDGWDYGATSSSQEDFDKSGVTSAHSAALYTKPEWAEVSRFIHQLANGLVRSVYTGDDVISLVSMWTTVYPPGAFVPQHLHPNCLLSGVYYAKAPENCGHLVFQDPAYIGKVMHTRGPNRFPTLPEKYVQEVSDGVMVIFPSWLPHSTQPNRSTEDRIIVSFNLGFSAAAPPGGARPASR
jgi:uncharacterized protein (TIGR02466 family)